MRKVVIGLVGIALLVSLSGGPHPSEAADSCSVSGGYDLNGFALGDAEVVGSLVFSPIVACTGGTFAGTITIRVDASPATVVPVSGTYTVGSDATITITAPGLVTLTGRVSQLANDLANAIHTVGDIGGAINVAVTMTRSALRGVATVLNRNASVFTLINLPTPTIVYAFTLPAGTPSVVAGSCAVAYCTTTSITPAAARP
ncbi:MAG: hypothetical protein HYY12_01985 [Candidatus Methylomirabilis oxyfera]|nr:hypothetical protein [Candidatus Methylomirabilis oxyfera]